MYWCAEINHVSIRRCLQCQRVGEGCWYQSIAHPDLLVILLLLHRERIGRPCSLQVRVPRPKSKLMVHLVTNAGVIFFVEELLLLHLNVF